MLILITMYFPTTYEVEGKNQKQCVHKRILKMFDQRQSLWLGIISNYHRPQYRLSK